MFPVITINLSPLPHSRSEIPPFAKGGLWGIYQSRLSVMPASCQRAPIFSYSVIPDGRYRESLSARHARCMLSDEHMEQDLGGVVILRGTKDLAKPWYLQPGHRSIALASIRARHSRQS
jgi:hypothetical protein